MLESLYSGLDGKESNLNRDLFEIDSLSFQHKILISTETVRIVRLCMVVVTLPSALPWHVEELLFPCCLCGETWLFPRH